MTSPHSDGPSDPVSPHDLLQTIAIGFVVPSVSAATTLLPPPTSTPATSTDAPASAKATSADPASGEIPPPYAPVPPSWLWLREHDQAFVGVCIAVFLLVGSYHWALLSGWGALPLEIDRQAAHRYDYKIDINSAGLIEWTQIEGIGEITAQKIIDDRAVNGPFRNITDLQRVKGIGPATVAKIRPYVRHSPPPNPPKTPVGSAADNDQQ